MATTERYFQLHEYIRFFCALITARFNIKTQKALGAVLLIFAVNHAMLQVQRRYTEVLVRTR
jgi:hypothetical protein